MTQQPLVVAYGGGTNSTAMLCGFREQGIKPDLIIFADTGGELPHTYDHVEFMSCKAKQWFGVGIEIVTATFHGQPETLEASCIRKKILPSLAYGFKACSMKHKIEPQKKRIRAFMRSAKTPQITNAIGYDAAEAHRKISKAFGVLAKGLTEQYWYPLIDWQWRRQECVEAIKRHGLLQPGKFSCFFCPAMKFGEIIRLKQEHPEHFARAIAMEQNMTVKDRVRGLNFGVPWSEIVAADEQQLKFMEFMDDIDAAKPNAHVPCGCYDG